MKEDNVNHPKHYTSHPSGVECITITEHMSFLRGNALKYLWRADEKNGLEDLKKAAWYLNREIEKQEPKGALLSPTRPMEVSGLMPFFHDERTNGLQPDPAPLGAKRSVRRLKAENVTTTTGPGTAWTTKRGIVPDIAEKFLAAVKAKPGQRSEEIARNLGVKKLPMPAIRAALKGKIKLRGKRRGTTYWPR